MSLVVVIVVVIVILLFLLVFTLGFFMGLGRKKKDIALIEKEQQLQKKTQENIISRFLFEDKEDISTKGEESLIYPIKIINRGYRRIKKYIKIKQIVNQLKEIQTVRYFRKYLLSYIGIAVLVFGFGYFVKFAVSATVVPISGRFIISVFISLLIIAVSHFIRKKYKTFSSILMGGALGSLYITFTISFYVYNIFTNLQIFGIFFILTTFSVALSIFYNRFELMLLAVIAGFIGPIFSSFDFNEARILLIYILVLDIGAIFISVRFKNFFIRLIPALFTGGYMIFWMRYCLMNNDYEGFNIDFFILTLIYLVLVILAVIYNVKTKTSYKPYELMAVLVINLIYYSIGMYMLNELNPDYKGIYTAVVAIFNIIFLIIILQFRKDSSEQLIYFFVIISLLFLTLIPPVELVGKSITMIWAVEIVLLMWVSIKLDIKMLKLVSTFLMIGLTASFVLDVIDNYIVISVNAPDKRLLINKSFISGIMTSLGLGLNVIIMGKSHDKYLLKPVRMSHLRVFIAVVAIGALYISLHSEILYHLTLSVEDSSLLNMYMGIYNFAFILISVVILTFINKKSLRLFSGIIAVLSTAFFFSVYLYDIIAVRDHLLLFLSISMKEFILHLVLITFILFIIFFAYVNMKKMNKLTRRISQWISTFLIIAVLITEIDHLIVINNHGSGIPVSSVLASAHYFYYTIFWAFSALFLSVYALLFNDKELIRISIFIIFATLIKLFAVDVSNIDTWERTFSYISVGIITLFIAFVRQRLFERLDQDKSHVFKNV